MLPIIVRPSRPVVPARCCSMVEPSVSEACDNIRWGLGAVAALRRSQAAQFTFDAVRSRVTGGVAETR